MISLRGELLGVRLDGTTGGTAGEVVRVVTDHRPAGPAGNAMVFVEVGPDSRTARYLSWINYYDLDYTAGHQQGWQVIEPAVPYQEVVAWHPFGWDGALRVPCVGDLSRWGGPQHLSLRG